jgi:hypothetical protein
MEWRSWRAPICIIPLRACLSACAIQAEMQGCDNDKSGLPLAKLRLEALWETQQALLGTDITLVTQMSPKR